MKKSLLFVFVLALTAAARAQQLDPQTQISWPRNCNNTPGMTYNSLNNTCIDMNAIDPSHQVMWPAGCQTSNSMVYAPGNNKCFDINAIDPTSQVKWPASCTSGVYSPASNTCVPTGTASNPAGNPQEVQINNGSGSMGAATGVTYDGNGGINASGNVGAATVTTGSLPGYRQSASARTRNRDEILQLTVTPQDMPGCQNSGMGLIDDGPCFNAALAYLAGGDKNAVKRLLVPWTPLGYTFRSANYLQPLPHDFGDYHGFAGYTAMASVSLYIGGGAIQSCAVQGGSGYAPNAQLPVSIYDPALTGSGAYAQVATDATGTPQSCTVIQAGMNYSTGGVTANIDPLGGDGAAGNCTLTNGVLSACAVTAGGSGYYTATGPANPPANVAGMTGCTTPPAMTTTVANNAISGVTLTNGGAGCSYQGNNGGSTGITVPISFGASCNGVQCTLLPPETPVNQPCAVALRNSVTIEGIGSPTINTIWDTASVDTNEMIAFCEPTGVQSAFITIKNITIGTAFIGFYFPYVVHQLKMEDVRFGVNVGVPFYAYGIGNNPNYTASGSIYRYGYGFPSDPPYAQTVFRNINLWSSAGFVCGGAWVSRQQNGTLNYNSGGYQNLLYGTSAEAAGNSSWQVVGHVTEPASLTGCGSVKMENIWFGAGAISTTQTNIDKWFEQYIWKTQNGPVLGTGTNVPSTVGTMSSGLAPNNAGTPGCKYTQTVTTDRTVDFQFGYPVQTPGNNQSYPYMQCYTGIASIMVVAQPRYSSVNGGSQFTVLDSAASGYPSRPMMIGKIDDVNVYRSSVGARTGFGDPYQQTGETRGAITVSTRDAAGSVATRLDDFGTSGFTGGSFAMISQMGTVYANQFYRQVTGQFDYTPYFGAIGSTTPTGPGAGIITLIDSSTNLGGGAGYGAGGAVGFGGSNNGTHFASIKGELIGQYYGDLAFFIRSNSNGAMNEAMRINNKGQLVTTEIDVAKGTQTISGCSLTSAVGGMAAGAFSTGATACTVTITFTGGFLAFNGIRCAASNLTNPGNLMNQTATSSTTCTLSGTTAIGDRIVWQAIAF